MVPPASGPNAAVRDAALDLVGGLTLEDGRAWAETATPLMWSDMAALLDVDSPVRRHWISRHRGYAKTSDLAAATVAVMLTPGQLPHMGRA